MVGQAVHAPFVTVGVAPYLPVPHVHACEPAEEVLPVGQPEQSIVVMAVVGA